MPSISHISTPRAGRHAGIGPTFRSWPLATPTSHRHRCSGKLKSSEHNCSRQHSAVLLCAATLRALIRNSVLCAFLILFWCLDRGGQLPSVVTYEPLSYENPIGYICCKVGLLLALARYASCHGNAACAHVVFTCIAAMMCSITKLHGQTSSCLDYGPQEAFQFFLFVQILWSISGQRRH